MDPKDALFDTEVIELMKSVFEAAAAVLPASKRTSSIKAEMASSILACAANGERNPAALKAEALRVVETHLQSI